MNTDYTFVGFSKYYGVCTEFLMQCFPHEFAACDFKIYLVNTTRGLIWGIQVKFPQTND